MKTKQLLFFICLIALSINAFSQSWTAGTGTLYTNPSTTLVGIGTTTPARLLHVFDTKNATYSPTGVPTTSSTMENNNNSTTNSEYCSLGFGVCSQTGGSNSGGYITLLQPVYTGTGKASNFTFSLRNAAGNTNEIMRIQSDGNVGIGTTSPDNLIQVAGLVDFDNTNYNTFLGNLAGNSNSTGNQNSFLGYLSGYSNVKGANNSFLGYEAAYDNTYAGENVAVGSKALYTQSYVNNYTPWSSYNVAVGNNSLFNLLSTTSLNGIKNTAIGYASGQTITTGDSNTFVGYGADVATTGGAFNNCAAFGFGTLALGSDKMYFGNAKVVGCYNATGLWTSSDGRFKINVQENVKGLAFINKLRPVTYNMDTKALDGFINNGRNRTKVVSHTITQTYTDSTGTHTTTNTIYDTIPGYNPNSNADFTSSTSIIHTGFIAQSVDSAAKACGFKSDIVSIPTNSNEPYALNYAEFVVPLVKAVQELSKQLDSLKSVLATTGTNQRQIHNGSNNDTIKNTQNIILLLPDAPILGEPQPNPNSGSTQINYYLPQNTSDAKIIFTDMLGKVMDEKPLQTGYGLLNIDTQNLPSGIYSYTLVIDGKVFETKKMIRNK